MKHNTFEVENYICRHSRRTFVLLIQFTDLGHQIIQDNRNTYLKQTTFSFEIWAQENVIYHTFKSSSSRQ